MILTFLSFSSIVPHLPVKINGFWMVLFQKPSTKIFRKRFLGRKIHCGAKNVLKGKMEFPHPFK